MKGFSATPWVLLVLMLVWSVWANRQIDSERTKRIEAEELLRYYEECFPKKTYEDKHYLGNKHFTIRGLNGGSISFIDSTMRDIIYVVLPTGKDSILFLAGWYVTKDTTDKKDSMALGIWKSYQVSGNYVR